MKKKIVFTVLFFCFAACISSCENSESKTSSLSESKDKLSISEPEDVPTPSVVSTSTPKPTSTPTPTPEPVLSNLDAVLSGANNNQWIYIDGIVDNFRETSTGYDFNIFYQTSDGYNITAMYPPSYIIDQKVPEGLKNGDILRMKQYITESHAGQSFADMDKIGEASMEEVYSTYKSSCPLLDYSSVIRMPVGVFDKYIKCQFTGEIIQVVDEGGDFGIPNYLIKSGEDIVSCTYARSSENRDMRFIEGDIVTIYGECQALTTYDTLVGENTVPYIWAYLIDLN